jgi:antibiotic biosynthesis monooxygenase (ABM) superfamily enzyme
VAGGGICDVQDGKAYAADEPDRTHHRPGNVASVHVRAIITWLAIFPMVALGMTVLGLFADSWPPVLRALVLTAFVVPVAVYLLVPRLLRAELAMRDAVHRRRSRIRVDPTTSSTPHPES